MISILCSVFIERNSILNFVHINMCVNPDVIMILKSLQFSKFIKLQFLKTIFVWIHIKNLENNETRPHCIVQASVQFLGSHIFWLWFLWCRLPECPSTPSSNLIVVLICKHFQMWLPIPICFSIGQYPLSWKKFLQRDNKMTSANC